MKQREELNEALEFEYIKVSKYQERHYRSLTELKDFYYELEEKDEDSLQDLLKLKDLIGELLYWEHEIEESGSEIDLIRSNLEA